MRCIPTSLLLLLFLYPRAHVYTKPCKAMSRTHAFQMRYLKQINELSEETLIVLLLVAIGDTVCECVHCINYVCTCLCENRFSVWLVQVCALGK